MDKNRWKGLYGRLEKVTPRAFDCGRLCGQKCCSPREEGLGIYLFSGEEVLFPGGEDWYRVLEYGPGAAYFTGDRGMMINCAGKCPRERRPLACRMFPLAPHINSAGGLEVIMDGDALFICPMVKAGAIEIMEQSFRDEVRRVWEELILDGAVREGVETYSGRIDRQAADPWLRLLEK